MDPSQIGVAVIARWAVPLERPRRGRQRASSGWDKPMIRLAIRCTIVAGILAALLLALLCAPDGSSLAPWEREPVTLLLALCAPVLAAVALVIGAAAMHRWTDLLDAMGLPYSHQRHIEEAEARGEAPA